MPSLDTLVELYRYRITYRRPSGIRGYYMAWAVDMQAAFARVMSAYPDAEDLVGNPAHP